jgi:hypothetical protein
MHGGVDVKSVPRHYRRAVSFVLGKQTSGSETPVQVPPGGTLGLMWGYVKCISYTVKHKSWHLYFETFSVHGINEY